MQNNIILVGFMGCGKSTVGKLLAEQLHYKFIDTDTLIEQNENMSVNDIFSQKGEEYFRVTETTVAKDLSQKNGLVIATGGGMMLNPDNAKALNQTGITFWIKVTPETVLKRLADDTSRPLLQREDKEAAVRELMQLRERSYASVCAHHVDGNGEPTAVVKKILAIL